MNIVMHCLGMPFNGSTINERSLGGSESAAYYMAKELAAAGHDVTLFTTHQQEGIWDNVKYINVGEIREGAPLGVRFHFYAENTPHDVCIIQRHPTAFAGEIASKVNLLWLHDLALQRSTKEFQMQMWNVDGVLTVSEWHKQQICKVYGLSPDIVYPITNGIDLSLFDGQIQQLMPDAPVNTKFLLYSSRPERGLEHLVRPGGIMDRLQSKSPQAHLLVCNYDNVTPQTKEYYRMLEGFCDQLPNVTMIGHLTKRQLADLMRQCTLHVYPTEFEEVSCITAMETMAAGLPMITSRVAALPETCEGSGIILLPLKGEIADEDAFVNRITALLGGEIPKLLISKQKEAAEYYSWKNACARLSSVIENVFDKARSSLDSRARHLLRTSDIYALKIFLDQNPSYNPEWLQKELDTCYSFAFNNNFKQHYEGYYEYEKARGVNYGPEDLSNNTRYEHVCSLLTNLPADSTVLDYGCAHGHFTINLAKRYPQINFVGVDLAASNIAIARKWAEDEQVTNAKFLRGDAGNGIMGEEDLFHEGPESNAIGLFDAIIAAEVLEHVADPAGLADRLCDFLKPNGLFIGTTPFGPWESQGYKEHWPWRAHLWHFEKEDLKDIWGMHKDFNVAVAPAGHTPYGEILGSYIFTFSKPTTNSGFINYERKFKYLAPRQTLSVCMISRDAELTIGKCLESVSAIADEIIVAIDEKTTDETLAICEKYGAKTFSIKSPTEIGFDAARNLSIEKATGEWILWIDSDEVLYQGVNVVPMLRNNMFSGYAVPQHHYSVFPPCIIKTDFPCRFFRNGKKIKFFGLVHEHPETEVNLGVGHVTMAMDVAIGHYGYSTELVRRNRFQRNVGLLANDRKKYPNRKLGKFLWLRDLAQMCQWEAEQNGGRVTQGMLERAKEGIKLWEELLDDDQLRMLVDGMDFYSTLSRILYPDTGFDMAFKMDTSKMNGGTHLNRQPEIKAFFASKKHADKLMRKLLEERTNNYDSKYF